MASLSAQPALCLSLFLLMGLIHASAERQLREFDYFALSLQWPGTFCHRTRHCCSKNACCRGSNAPTEFTIHGLWPDYNDGTWPACCTRSTFDEKQVVVPKGLQYHHMWGNPLLRSQAIGLVTGQLKGIQVSTLHDALEKYWPSLSCGTTSTCHGSRGSLWAHEWEKHGTCSSPVVHDEYDYFLTTLNVYFKYNVTHMLHEAGYVPSNTEKYPLGGIVSAVESSFRATPEVVCSKDNIEEIRLCFYKDFKPCNCLIHGSSCPKYVGLPTYVSLGVDGGNGAPWVAI